MLVIVYNMVTSFIGVECHFQPMFYAITNIVESGIKHQ
jgi:hypothetical protein